MSYQEIEEAHLSFGFLRPAMTLWYTIPRICSSRRVRDNYCGKAWKVVLVEEQPATGQLKHHRDDCMGSSISGVSACFNGFQLCSADLGHYMNHTSIMIIYDPFE